MDSLETERLIIRPFCLDELEEVYDLLDRDLEWAGPGFGLEQRRERLALQVGLASWLDTGRIYGHRAVRLKEGERLIGIVHFHPELWPPAWKQAFWPRLFEWYRPEADGCHASLEMGIGYALSSRERGQGYAAEAVRRLLAHAFEELELARVFALTDRDNEDSIRLMARVGMRTARNPDANIVYPAAAGVIEKSGWDRTSR